MRRNIMRVLPDSNANKASLSLEDGFSYNITGQGFINYIRSFGNHNINSGLVFEFSDAENRSTVTSRGEFPSTVLDMMAGGIANKQVTNSEVFRKYRTASFIGRFSYDYRSKYFVDFNFRYDGAQYFADKWGFFLCLCRMDADKRRVYEPVEESLE